MRARPVARAALVAGLALGVMPVLGANPAYACSCIESTEQENYERATHVFKATVNGVESTFPADGGTGSMTYTFDVETAYKGEIIDPQRVSTAGDSAACGVNLDGAGPFLVFASAGDGGGSGGGELAMNLCGGTRSIGADEEPSFAPAEPGDQDPGGGSPPSERDDGEEAGAVGQVVSKVAGYLGELLGPLKE